MYLMVVTTNRHQHSMYWISTERRCWANESSQWWPGLRGARNNGWKVLAAVKLRIIHDSLIVIDPTVQDEYQVPEHGKYLFVWISSLNTTTLFLDGLFREVQNESSLLYTRQRDIRAVGIVFFRCWWVLMWRRGSQLLKRPLILVSFFFRAFILFICWMLDLFSVDISSFSLAVPEHVAAVLKESR